MIDNLADLSLFYFSIYFVVWCAYLQPPQNKKLW